jgi:predicted PurR-regulated permease PerM
VLVRWFQRAVLSRRWLSFLVLCLAFAAFGVGTYNLFNLLKLNLELIAEHGFLALMEGALQQLAELMGTLFVSMLAYIVFKACEHRLVHGLIDTDKDPHA